MCGVYANADPILYETRTRSLRIHGVITTVRLENEFWNVLQEIAERESMTTNRLIAKLYDERVDLQGDAGNFTSFLRVCCVRYLAIRKLSAFPSHQAALPHSRPTALKAVQ